MLDKKKFTVALVIAITIALFFWTQSRLPQLNEKAQMGQRNNISAIAFNPVYSVDPEEPYLYRVAKTSANWGHTNWKGMTFGLFFAAAFLSLFKQLPKRPASTNRFLNALKGLITGVPLGVCVNCTTPIAYGMHKSGINLSTVLSTLMSSPTLNIVVLTMAFTLLPLHLAIIKTLSAILFILVVIPLLVQLSTRRGWVKPQTTSSLESINRLSSNQNSLLNNSNPDQCGIEPTSKNWLNAVYDVSKDFLANSIYIIKMTLPLMIAAGILGALIIEAINTEQLYAANTGIVTLLIAALLGTLLPVPIAFDIIIVVGLIVSGLPISLSMALLFSLSIFSIYPALIIAKNISIKLSAALIIITTFFAASIGAFSEIIDTRINKNASIDLINSMELSLHKRMLTVAFEECEKEPSKVSPEHCMETFFNSGLAKPIKLAACSTSNQLTDQQVQLCQQSINRNSVFSEALETKNINHCLTLPTPKEQGICWMNYATSRALDPKSIDLCDTFQNPKGKQQCQQNILLYRTARIQNDDACDLNLPQSVIKDCLNHVRSMVNSLGGDLSTCNRLSSKILIHNCQKNMFLLEITDEKNYSFCTQLIDPELKQQCDDFAQFSKAKNNANPDQCQSIQSVQLKNQCIVAAKMGTIERRILEDESFTINDSGETAQETTKSQTSNIIPTPPSIEWHTFSNSIEVEIFFTPLKKSGDSGANKFIQVSGSLKGVENPIKTDLHDLFEPLNYGGGIATGDFNNDFWPDLVLSSDDGIHLYQNNGDGSFGKITSFIPSTFALHSILVTFVDINNDGWQDLFVSAFDGTNYFFLNHQGTFNFENKIEMKAENRLLTLATGFSDWNKDGYLDFVFGNWSYGTDGAFNPEHSHNEWIVNKPEAFQVSTAPELQGDTLSILLTDINQDNNVDMIVANDREYPDHYYFGNSNGHFESIDSGSTIPITSLNNMSVDTADFNNDLLLDLFSSDMSFSLGIQDSYCQQLKGELEREHCLNLLDGYRALEEFDVSWCNKQINSQDREICLTSLAIRIANRDHKSDYCDNIPNNYHTAKSLCLNLSQRGDHKVTIDSKIHIQQKQQNTLLIQTAPNKFEDQTRKLGVQKSFWSWNGKAADLDNDQWQDLYIGNGYEFGTKNNEIHSNVFFHNQNGEGFKQKEKQFGLDSYINTSSYSYSDIDLDGDIDIIATGVMSTPTFFINQGNDNHHISFDLRENTLNHFCIACRIIIHYGENESQIRELKLSGGFQSFDNPVVYFGLGLNDSVEKVELIWSDGEVTHIVQPLPADRRYLIKRQVKSNNGKQSK